MAYAHTSPVTSVGDRDDHTVQTEREVIGGCCVSADPQLRRQLSVGHDTELRHLTSPEGRHRRPVGLGDWDRDIGRLCRRNERTRWIK
jgi:hypothetical protein